MPIVPNHIFTNSGSQPRRLDDEGPARPAADPPGEVVVAEPRPTVNPLTEPPLPTGNPLTEAGRSRPPAGGATSPAGGHTILDIRAGDSSEVDAPQPDKSEVASQRALRAFANGYGEMLEELEGLEDLLRSGLVGPDALAQLQLNISVLKASLGGKVGVDARKAEIDDLLPRAFFAPADHEQILNERDALARVSAGLEPLEDRVADIDDLKTRALLTPEGLAIFDAERGALQAFLHGNDHLRSEIAEVKDLMTRAMMTPEMHFAMVLKLTALEAVAGGLPGVEAALRNADGPAKEMLERVQRSFALVADGVD